MAESKVEEAQALKKLVSERVKVATKETSMDKIRQREKKYQKLAKTIDHLERAKREEFAPLIEAAYKQSCQQGLVEERERHKHEQQANAVVNHAEEAGRLKQLEESLWRPAEPSEPPRPVQPAVAPSTEKYVVKQGRIQPLVGGAQAQPKKLGKKKN
ncbi:hypothetical protein ACLB2K_039853 [Fragaria x ananassa]